MSAERVQRMAVDLEARRDAQIARTKIESHEDECARRYGEVAAAIQGIHGEFAKIRNVNMYALISIVGLLMTICGFLIVNGAPWTHGGVN